jgi:hypothetical protein
LREHWDAFFGEVGVRIQGSGPKRVKGGSAQWWREQEGKLIAAVEGRVDGKGGRGRTQRCCVKEKDGEDVKYRMVYDWFAEGDWC